MGLRLARPPSCLGYLEGAELQDFRQRLQDDDPGARRGFGGAGRLHWRGVQLPRVALRGYQLDARRSLSLIVATTVYFLSTTLSSAVKAGDSCFVSSLRAMASRRGVQAMYLCNSILS